MYIKSIEQNNESVQREKHVNVERLSLLHNHLRCRFCNAAFLCRRTTFPTDSGGTYGACAAPFTFGAGSYLW